MSFSRRAFVKTVGLGSAGVLSGGLFIARARDAVGGLWSETLLAAERPLLLHFNENPLGPRKAVFEAVRGALGSPSAYLGRYPFASSVQELREAIAKRIGVSADNILIGHGSTQILRTATHVFTSEMKPLVAGASTFEACGKYAGLVGTPLRAIPLDDSLRLDLGAMTDAVEDAGLVFLNNPNNPTATVHSEDAVASFIDRVRMRSPNTTILVDEAYHDYVTDPSHKSQYALAVKDPRVMVTRTFSKVHGMAGLRVGYAIGHPDTLKTMQDWQYNRSLNTLGVVGAIAAIKDTQHVEQERQRNTATRDYTIKWFERAGFSATDSQTNFIFANIGRPAQPFREECLKLGVKVGRDFPPYEASYVRVSIGTMDQMRQATEVFGRVLGVGAASGAAA